MAGNLQQPMIKTLIASNAVIATGASAAFTIGLADSYTFYLSCTPVTGTSPTMDAIFQTSIDGGTTYVNVPWRYTQLTAAANLEITVRCGLGIGEAGVASPAAATGGVLANPCVVDPLHMKLAYTIAGTSPSFTFTLVMIAMPRGSTGIS